MKGLLVSLHITSKLLRCSAERNELTNIGSETRTLVEIMYSLSYLYQAVGDNDFAGKCERTVLMHYQCSSLQTGGQGNMVRRLIFDH